MRLNAVWAVVMPSIWKQEFTKGYGPGGTAVMVECLVTTQIRTISQVRPGFTKCGGNLGTEGSVGYLFSKKAILIGKVKKMR